MKDPIEISIIIPVYNEEDNVVALYQEIVETLPLDRVLFEVIFVDDGSIDKTRSRLHKLQPEAAYLRIVSHAKNFGQSASIYSGARAAKYPLLVTLDGDGQNDPKDILTLVECFQAKQIAATDQVAKTPQLSQIEQDKQTPEEQEAIPNPINHKLCVVFGSRARREDTAWRIIASRVSNGIRQWLLKDKCFDTGCSLKVFPREAFLSLPHFNHFHRFFPALFQRAGFEIINIPVNHRPRQHGVSKYGTLDRLWSGIHDLIGVHWLMKRSCLPEILPDEY